MTSLTTLFVVGPEEYVEFNESMGSKAFLEHIWDQSRSPLKREETSASGTQLHSAGARISQTPPPKIEFPTVLRMRGRGNRYQATGKFISWEELKRRNPMALKDPPSLEEFIHQGSQVGVAERLEPGAFLKGEKRFKINKRPKGTVEVHEDDDGWIGGSSESVYADKGSLDSIYATASKQTVPLSKTSEPSAKLSAEVASDSEAKSKVDEEPIRTLRKSRSGLSLSARLGMDDKKVEEAPPLPAPTNVKSNRPDSKSSKPTYLSLPENSISSLSLKSGESTLDTTFDAADGPLSATHSPPETPMKYPDNKRSINISATPVTEKRLSDQQADLANSTTRSALHLDAGQERFVTSCQATEKASATPAKAARSQIDEMLAKLRQARSGFSGGGSGESMWAPKAAAADSNEKVPSQSLPSKTTTDRISEGKGASKKTESAAHTTPAEADKPAREKVERKKPVSNTQKSLLDRLGPKVAEKKEETEFIGKAVPVDHSTAHPTPGHRSKPSEVTLSTPVAERGTQEDESAHRNLETVSTSTSGDVAAKEDEVSSNELPQSIDSKDVKEAIPSSASKISDSDNLSAVGNDTLTSINWADDDDDESLPDLPDDWGKPILSASPNASAERRFSTTSSSVASVGNHSEAGDTLHMPQRNGKDRASKRGKKVRTEKRGKKDDDGQTKDAVRQPPTGPRGMKIAGSANGKSTASATETNAALPYWERRKAPSNDLSRSSTSPPSAPLGMRIAGTAQTPSNATKPATQREGLRAGRGKPRELFPHANTVKQPTKPRSGKGMTLPPNLKPLESTFAPSAAGESKAKVSAARPRISTKGDEAFARLSKGTLGVNGNAEQPQRAKKAEDQKRGKGDSMANRSAKGSA